MGSRMILANAYHLYLRPGDVLIKEIGGIQRFAGWDGAVLTDSGGYQVFSLGGLRKIEEAGVTFQSHIDGSKHFLSPERIVEVQENIGADVCMCLDECVAYPATHPYTAASVDRTTRWAQRSRAAKSTPSLLFGIVQGGMYADLRQKSAADLLEIDFDGYALGGFSVGEPKEVMWEMVDGIIGLMPPEKPRYLMGVGFPEDIVEGVTAANCLPALRLSCYRFAGKAAPSSAAVLSLAAERASVQLPEAAWRAVEENRSSKARWEVAAGACPGRPAPTATPPPKPESGSISCETLL